MATVVSPIIPTPTPPQSSVIGGVGPTNNTTTASNNNNNTNGITSSSSTTITPLLFYYQPLFHPLYLPDTSPIEDALQYILLLRKKSLYPLINKLSDSIKLSLGGGGTIGDLRRLTDSEWKLLDIPAMCKIYLKHLVRTSQPNKNIGNKKSNAVPLTNIISTNRAPSPLPSSSSFSTINTPPPPPLPPHILQLSNDFNNGIPIDLSIYSQHLSTLRQIGFDEKDALEALLITDNRGPELALEILLSDPLVKKQKREDAIAKRRANNINNNNNNNNNANNGAAAAAAAAAAAESAFRIQIETERVRAELAEKELALHIANLPRTVYKEFIRGLIADREISLDEYDQLKAMRERKKISPTEHAEILRELGVSNEEFEKMKKFDAKTIVDFECVICLDKQKSVIIFPCMHLCLCDTCEKNINGKKDAKCPICQKAVAKTQKIFFS